MSEINSRAKASALARQFLFEQTIDMAALVLIHGLNTYGDSEARLGPIKFGSMYAPLKYAFEAKGHLIVELHNLGFDSIENQTRSAAKQLTHLLELHRIQKFHILAQSTGGLIARQLSHHKSFSEQILTITTIGCPHHGSVLPLWTKELRERQPWIYRFLKIFGYNIEEKQTVFEQFLPENISSFSKVYPQRFDISQGHILCEVRKNEMGWPFRFLNYLLLKKLRLNEPGDGLIDSNSQNFGQQYARLSLDHFAQIGYFLSADPKVRRKMQNEFNQLIQIVDALIKQ